MSRSQSNIPPEVKAEMDKLKAACEYFERKGLFDTAHHTMLARLKKQYSDLVTLRKIEVKDEVKDGE